MDWTKSITTELATGERELPEEPKEEDDYSSASDEE
jgi:hypothetical protein